MACLDASVLIPLARIGKLSLLKKYFKTAKTTSLIKEELLLSGKPGRRMIRDALGTWLQEISVADKKKEIRVLASEENLDEADASVLVLAKAEADILVTNDLRLHAVAKSQSVQTMWLKSFLLACVCKKILSKKHAHETLYELIQAGVWLRADVYAAIDRKIDEL